MNTKKLIACAVLLLGTFAATAAFAEAPAGSTGECKDGTYTSAKTKRGACTDHGGVKTWFEQKSTAKKPAKEPAAKTESSKAKAATATEAPANAASQAPSGSTGECKDGTYTSAESKRGACAGHGGVKTWFGQKSTAKESSKATAKTESSKAEVAPATEAPAKAASRTTSAPASKATSNAPAASGGPGMVWVNTPTKVYHCSGDRWYGKTKHGEYMSEADAKAKGNRPDHNKPCS